MSFMPGMFPVIAAAKRPDPIVRHVGQYSCVWTASTTATVNITGTDLQLPNEGRQLVVAVRSELGVVTTAGVTIAGIQAPRLSTENTLGSCNFFSAVLESNANFSIVITTTASITETTAIDVFEVSNAAPMFEQLAAQCGTTTTTPGTTNLRIPSRAAMIAALIGFTDTVAVAWTGLTEINDADVGSNRASTAADLVLSIIKENNTITVAPASNAPIGATILPVVPHNQRPSIAFHNFAIVGAVATTVTFTAQNSTNFTGLGSFRLYFTVLAEANATVTGVTRNGVAMTSVGSIVNSTPNPDLLIHTFYQDVTQASPTGNIVVTFSANINGLPVSVMSCRVYRASEVGTVYSVSGNGTGNALAVDLDEDTVVMAMHIRGTNTQTISWASINGMISLGFDATNYRSSVAFHNHSSRETGRPIQAIGSASGEYATLAIAVN